MEKVKKIITITTDFGDRFAATQVKAVAIGLGFSGELIENNSVTPFSIVEGAQIQTLTRFCPEGSVHVGVVDPEVGSDRWGIVIETASSWLVGPNNGLLYPTAVEQGIKTAWKIDETYFQPPSATFHGRDVFIKAAVLLVQAETPTKFNCQKIAVDQLKQLIFQSGQVLHIDPYGNVKIHWPDQLVTGSSLIFSRQKIPIVETFSDVERGQPLVLNGSSGTLELAVNCGSAAEEFELKLGQVVDDS